MEEGKSEVRLKLEEWEKKRLAGLGEVESMRRWRERRRRLEGLSKAE